MASLPNPLYVLLTENRYFRVDNAASITDADITDYKDGSTFRDLFNNAYRAPVDPSTTAGLLIGSAELTGAATLAATTLAGVMSVTTGGTSAAASMPDDVAHAPLRQSKLTRTERQFVGATKSITGTTVSGSGIITVPDSTLFAVGMVVTGTGIGSGALVSSITDATHVVLSVASSASATVVLTVGGTDVLARCWVDEFVCYSAYPPQVVGRTAILWPS